MFFTVPVPADIVNTSERMAKEAFIPAWQSIANEHKVVVSCPGITHADVEKRLGARQMHVVAKRRTKSGELWCVVCS